MPETVKDKLRTTGTSQGQIGCGSNAKYHKWSVAGKHQDHSWLKRAGLRQMLNVSELENLSKQHQLGKLSWHQGTASHRHASDVII